MKRSASSRATSTRRRFKLGLKAGGGLTETDLNRLHKYYDLNGDLGGYLKKRQALVVRLAAQAGRGIVAAEFFR